METPPLSRQWIAPVRYAIAAANVAVAITATVVLVGGWLMDITILTQLEASLPAMVPSTAFCLLVLSCYMLIELRVSSMRRRHGPLRLALPSLVLLITAVNVALLLSGIANGLDAYLFPENLRFSIHAMSPATSLHLAGCSLALMLAGLAPNRFALVIMPITFFGVFLSLTVILGYFLNAGLLLGSPLFATEALHTAICLFFLSVSILQLYPELGALSVLVGTDRSSEHTRLLLLIIVAVPVLILIILTFAENGPNTRFVLSLFALFAIALQTSIAIRNSAATSHAENDLKAALVELGAVVQDRERLLAEVNHRSKNLLSVIQSVAAMSANGPETKSFAGLLTDRLRGLATSQDLMIRNNWRFVALSELVASHLDFLGPSILRRVDVSGPVVILSTSAAQQIGQALQELATNALKYGALSTPNGTVKLIWRLVERGDSCEKTFRIEWLENGGPRIQTPVQQGYGLQVLEKITAYSMCGDVALKFDPEGLSWVLEAPQSEVTAVGNAEGETQIAHPDTRGAA